MDCITKAYMLMTVPLMSLFWMTVRTGELLRNVPTTDTGMSKGLEPLAEALKTICKNAAQYHP